MKTVATQEERVQLRHRRGRKAVDLVLDEKHPQGRDVVWAAIRKLRAFTVATLERTTRVPEATIRSYLQGLQAAGFIERDEIKQTANARGSMTFRACTFRLTRDVGVEAPRVTRKGEIVTQGGGRERMWMQMRILKSFTQQELRAMSLVGQSPRPEEVNTYCKFLARAGYLRREQIIGARGRTTRYHVVPALYSGPRPPMIQNIKQVYDQNLGRVVWPRSES